MRCTYRKYIHDLLYFMIGIVSHLVFYMLIVYNRAIWRFNERALGDFLLKGAVSGVCIRGHGNFN